MADQTLVMSAQTPRETQTPSLFWLRAVACVFYGALLNAAFPPTGMWFAALGLALLFVLVARSVNTREAFALGFWFGVGFFASHLFWLPNSLSSPDLFGAVGWIIYPPLVLIEGVFWGIVTGLSRVLGRRGGGTLLVLPALWLLMEWARTQGPLAFPWGSLGYIWLGTPLAQAADIAGGYGLSLVTLLVAATLAGPFLSGTRVPFKSVLALAVSILVLGGVWSYGQMRLAEASPSPDKTALLVQGNTDPLGRARGETSDLDIYLALTAVARPALETPPDLVVWPEGAVLGSGVSVEVEGRNGEPTRLAIGESAGTSPVITGAGAWESGPNGPRRYNSVYALSNATVTGRYDKVYLVPFGESVPFSASLEPLYRTIYGWFGLSTLVGAPGEAFTPLTVPGASAAAYICYESVFPQVALGMVAQGAQVLVNISNDAWFGRGHGAEQHFAMGTMRAIETRRYLLRVGNDGVTAVVDPRGRTLQRLERYAPGSLLGRYALLEGETFYVRYGDWLLALTALYVLFFSIGRLLRRSPQASLLQEGY